MIVACDHPARGALGAAGRPNAMADRLELLDRLATALARPGVDGLLATADIAEDLLLLGALEDKVVFSSMNRGGLQGSAFEMDDRNTGYDVPGHRRGPASTGPRCSPGSTSTTRAPSPRSSARAQAVTELQPRRADRHGRALHVAPGRRQGRQRPQPPTP